ncbi:GNPAT-like protein, partial [Mya arenaria]
MAISPWSIIAAVLLQNMDGIPLKQLLKEVEWLKRQASNLGAYIDWPVNESGEAVLKHNIYIHKNIARLSADHIVELIADDSAAQQSDDHLMTSAAMEMMVCLYRNQLLNVFVRVALITIPINSCDKETLPIKNESVLIKKSTNKYTTFFSQMFEPFLMGYWSGAHGKPLVKLPKAISKEAQILSARLLREGHLKHKEILSLDMMNN